MAEDLNLPDGFRFTDDGCFNPDHNHNHFVGKHNYKNFYLPWYNDRADYNTNAPSYYDYLARINHLMGIMRQVMNKLLDRDLQTLESFTVDMQKMGDWQVWDDIITLIAHVKVSTRNLNAIKIDSDQQQGLYVADLNPRLTDLENKVALLQTLVNSIGDRVTVLEGQMSVVQGQITQILTRLESIDNSIATLYSRLSSLSNQIENIELKVGTIASRDVAWTGSLTTGSIALDQKFQTVDYFEILVRWGSSYSSFNLNFRKNSPQNYCLMNQADDAPILASVESTFSVDSTLTPGFIIVNPLRRIQIRPAGDLPAGNWDDVEIRYDTDSAMEVVEVRGCWFNRPTTI